MGKGIEVPPGSESDKPYSKFMAIYAALCRNHMLTFGTTQRQIAAVSAKNHGHSVHNPYSQFRKSYSIDEILAAPPITYPLTLPMCAPLSDGSAAAILCTEDGLARIGADRSRCIRVAASVMRSFSNRRADQFELNLGRHRRSQPLAVRAERGVEPRHLGEGDCDRPQQEREQRPRRHEGKPADRRDSTEPAWRTGRHQVDRSREEENAGEHQARRPSQPRRDPGRCGLPCRRTTSLPWQ